MNIVYIVLEVLLCLKLIGGAIAYAFVNATTIYFRIKGRTVTIKEDSSYSTEIIARGMSLVIMTVLYAGINLLVKILKIERLSMLDNVTLIFYWLFFVGAAISMMILILESRKEKMNE